MDSLAKIALQAGGRVKQLTLPSVVTKGMGTMNPSIFNDSGKLKVIIRVLNYILYHNESQLYQHEFGPLQYIHPENDKHLRTYNFYAELSDDLEIEWFTPVDFGIFEEAPKWEFVGLEDARLFKHGGELQICGVRRDTTYHGEGRMELYELKVKDNTAKTVCHSRIPAPGLDNTYCEKNWVPVLGKDPLTFVKWHNPVEVVQYHGNRVTSELKQSNFQTRADLRGGSQVIPYGDGYISITHEVYLHRSELGSKNATYRHRFIYYDKELNVVNMSKDFSFMDADIEFCCGLTRLYNGNFITSFGFQDNSAFLLEFPESVLHDTRLHK